MNKELQLQQKLRRSEALTQQDIYKDFMVYAREVSDQLDIYAYMEENQIGIDIPQYWIARFTAMRERCQLVSLVQKIKKAKHILGTQETSINHFALRLRNELFHIISTQSKGKKRKVSSLSMMQRQEIHPQTRMIGNIQVYIDSPQRHHYQLEDYAKYIQKEMGDYVDIERGWYQRKQAIKPLSFLAKKQQHLLKLAEEFLSKKRKSYHDRNSRGTKLFSNRQTQKYDESFFQTPKYKENDNQNHVVDKQALRQKIESDRSKDSVEILKDMAEKKSENFKSPKFKHQYRDSSFNRQILNEKVRCHQEVDPVFSFGKKFKARSMSQQLYERPRNFKPKDSKDDAFIQYSFSKDTKSIDAQIRSFAVKREDFQLDLLIRQCQNQKYQKVDSKTFSSDIDSNQENFGVPQDNFFLQNFGNKPRKPFEVLLEMSSHNKDASQILLEHLIEREDRDDERNPQQFNQQERKISQKSEIKKRYNFQHVFYSERKSCRDGQQNSTFTFVKSSKN